MRFTGAMLTGPGGAGMDLASSFDQVVERGGEIRARSVLEEPVRRVGAGGLQAFRPLTSRPDSSLLLGRRRVMSMANPTPPPRQHNNP